LPGGLLLDTGFLILKKGDLESGLSNYRRNSLLPGQPKMEVTPMFDINDPVVVEWRALTITYSEIVASKVREKLRSRKSLSLSQVLEGGIWNVSYYFKTFYSILDDWLCSVDGPHT
jgi:hypothetical protein